MYKKKIISKGFTLTELMVGLSIGIVVLTGLMSFYFRSSKMIGEQQAIIKDLNQLQFVMNKIIDDIKEANTVPKEDPSIITAWGSIPYMGYGNNYLTHLGLVNTTLEPKEYPTYPVAYNFPYQSLEITDFNVIIPKLKPSDELGVNPPRESNQLVFYKIVNNQILRIIYYTDFAPRINLSTPEDLKIYRLRKKIQYPPDSTSLFLTTSDNDSILISELKYIQFTYPVLTKKLSIPTDPYYDVTTVDPILKNKITDITNDTVLTPEQKYHRKSNLINEFRNTIKINIGTVGPQIGNKITTAFQLSTEVTVRN